MIKTNNEGEEVFALPFSALDYEYLFWKYRLTRFKSEVIYSGKDSIGLSTHDKKKKDGKPKKNWRKNVSTKMFRVYMGFKVWEYHLSTNAVRRQYPPFIRSKYIPAQTTFRQQKDKLNYICFSNCLKVVFKLSVPYYFRPSKRVVLWWYCLSTKVVLPYLKPFPNPKYIC